MLSSHRAAVGRRLTAACLGATVALALTACNSDEVGAAAVVGDTRITVSELQDEVREIAALDDGGEPTGDQSSVQLAVLSGKIRHLLLAEVARDAGVSVSEADIDAFIDQQLLPQYPDGDLTPFLVQNSFTEDGLRDAVHDQLVFQQLISKWGEDELRQRLSDTEAELGIKVSPRYGTWSDLQVQPESGSISVEPGAEN